MFHLSLVFCQWYTRQSKKCIQIGVHFPEIVFTERRINITFVGSEEKLNCNDCFGTLHDLIGNVT
jgi:hypothetical protein